MTSANQEPNGSGGIAFDWGDGNYRFKLGIADLEELQGVCGAGPQAIYERLGSGTWLVGDVIQTLRLGLIGGGAAPEKAFDLVKRYAMDVERVPLVKNVKPAMAILYHALLGPRLDPVGKDSAEMQAPQTTSSTTTS